MELMLPILYVNILLSPGGLGHDCTECALVVVYMISWRHHQNISALLALCEGNPLVTGVFPSQRPVMRNFCVFFDLPLNKRLSKQSRGRWFEMPSRRLWHYCSGIYDLLLLYLLLSLVVFLNEFLSLYYASTRAHGVLHASGTWVWALSTHFAC